MTSLATAFEAGGAAAAAPALFVGGDEGERRSAYEHSRHKHTARGPPQQSHQRPVMASQESFMQQRPGEYEGRIEGASGFAMRGVGSVARGESAGAPRVEASCGSCQQDMCCSADGLFCTTCNRDALEPRKATEAPAEGPIASLFR